MPKSEEDRFKALAKGKSIRRLQDDTETVILASKIRKLDDKASESYDYG
jgi:hypothetical protein